MITDQHFLVQGSGSTTIDIELVHYGRSMSKDSVLKELDVQDYRAAKIDELLPLGATFPDLQRKFPIIALGSEWQGVDDIRGVPYLTSDGSERCVYLTWSESDFVEHCRFAAVRK